MRKYICLSDCERHLCLQLDNVYEKKQKPKKITINYGWVRNLIERVTVISLPINGPVITLKILFARSKKLCEK